MLDSQPSEPCLMAVADGIRAEIAHVTACALTLPSITLHDSAIWQFIICFVAIHSKWLSGHNSWLFYSFLWLDDTRVAIEDTWNDFEGIRIAFAGTRSHS